MHSSEISAQISGKAAKGTRTFLINGPLDAGFGRLSYRQKGVFEFTLKLTNSGGVYNWTNGIRIVSMLKQV